MKTFAEIRKEAQAIYRRVGVQQKETEKALEQLKTRGMTSVYTGTYLNQKATEIEKEFRDYCTVAAAEFRSMYQETISGKRAELDTMLITAPSPEQMNLLNALQLQGKNISKAELEAIAPQLQGNYRALHTFQVIAANAGFRVNIPDRCDYESLTEAVNFLETYLNQRANELEHFTTWRNAGMGFVNFFGPRWPDPDGQGWMDWPDNIYASRADLLDGNDVTPIIPDVSIDLPNAPIAGKEAS